MCVTARAGGRAPHETQSIFNYFGTGARNRGATTGCRNRVEPHPGEFAVCRRVTLTPALADHYLGDGAELEFSIR